MSIVYLKADGVEDRIPSWGNFIRYSEIGHDSFAMRHVDVFENGNCLRYDRTNWIDGLGLLIDMKYDALKWAEWWGPLNFISPEDFEQVWKSSEASPNQPQEYTCGGAVWPVTRTALR